jgi:hypothetical protein
LHNTIDAINQREAKKLGKSVEEVIRLRYKMI